MGDQDLWRKNLPDDFDGRWGENWDDEIEIKPILWTTVALAGSVVIAFVVCWGLLVAFDAFHEQPELSPMAEANERRLPPRPWVQPSPEAEMDDFLEEQEAHLESYGWIDQLDGRVHMPVDRAMNLVLEGRELTVPVGSEPPEDAPLDVQPSGLGELSGEGGQGEVQGSTGAGADA
ncbi:MAG: hypothetical protein AAGN66_00045 [Acidobacteriota bacterium]